MPVTRDRLLAFESQEVKLPPGTHKTTVLSLLARTPNQGYEPKEIAAETPIPKASVHKVLQRLLADDLVEKISDHYLVNSDHLEEINDALLTSHQFDVAEQISDENTAPAEIDAPTPEDLPVPTVDNLGE